MTISAALRHGTRRLWRYPAHSALAVLTLGLGIGLTTAMYAIVDGTFLRGLPFADADRLFLCQRVGADGRTPVPFRVRDFLALREGQTSFDVLTAWVGYRLNLSGGGVAAEPLNAGYATADLFRLTGVQAALGRTIGPEDERPGAPRVVLLSDDLWHQRFGGDPGVIGKSVRVSGDSATVIGVMPPRFRFPLNQYFWTALRLDEAERDQDSLQVIGRLRPGVAPERAAAEIRTLGSRLAVRDRRAEGSRALLSPFMEGYVDPELRSRHWLMLGAVFGVLLIACVNVAHLLLVRAIERTPEIAVRAALGAGRWSVAWELLVDSLVLAAAGGIAGLGIARAALALYRHLLGDEIPSFWVDVRLDARVFLFAFGLSLLAGVLAGLFPAFLAARGDPGEILKDRSRGATGLRLGRLGRALAVAEIALSCGLLIPTGLTVRSVTKLARLDPGFPADEVLTAQISIYGTGHDEEASLRRYYGELERRVASLPGARAVAFATSLPVGGWSYRGDFAAAGSRLPAFAARRTFVSPRYFGIFGLRPLEGRIFAAGDGPGSPPVAVVSRSFAERAFPGESAVGRLIREPAKARASWKTIVGVVPDLSIRGLGGDTPEEVYLSWDRTPPPGGCLVVRTAASPAALAAEIRRQAAAIDPEVPVWAFETMRERIGDEAELFIRAGTLFGLFGGVGLFLAALGLYGVMSFAVARRTREIGVRLALGARGADVRRLVLRAGLIQIALGTVLGLGLAAALSRLLAASLYQVKPWDPLAFVLAPIVLAAAGLLACLPPARRAARVDPMESLRAE
jgi:putative ABC transport system permease protein